MNTLATALAADSISRYPTVEELANLLDVEPTWIHQRRKEGLIEPRLTRGALQFDRGAVVRLAVFRSLQEVLGVKSAQPAIIVRSIASELDRCAVGPWIRPDSVERAIALGLQQVVRTLQRGTAARLAEVCGK